MNEQNINAEIVNWVSQPTKTEAQIRYEEACKIKEMVKAYRDDISKEFMEANVNDIESKAIIRAKFFSVDTIFSTLVAYVASLERKM